MKLQAKKNITNIIFVVLNLCMVILASVFLGSLERLIKVLIVLSFLILTLSVPAIGKKTVHKIFLVLSACGAVLLIGYIILQRTGAIVVFRDFSIVKNFILGTRQWGVFVFMLVAVLSAVILPIPAPVIILIGVAIYGPFWSFVMVSIATITGSVITFWIGKAAGKRLAIWLFGEEKIEKYSKLLGEKHRGMFVVMLLFPFFPDDLICVLAGISGMSFRFFIISVILTRPVMIAATAFLGSGEIIPFRGWGIPVWIGLFALTVGAFVVISFVKSRKTKQKISTENTLEKTPRTTK